MSPGDDRLADIVTTPDRRRRYEAAGLWNAETLAGRVAEHAARRPSKIAVVDLGGDRERTYGQLDRDASSFASRLVELGVRVGDVVSVQLPNWYETVVIQLGVLRAGAVLNPMLPIYRSKELRHMVTVGDVKVLVTPRVYRGHDHQAMVEELRADVSCLRHHLVVDDPEDDADAFLGALEHRSDAPPSPVIDAAAVSELMFTSGTEAQPKAIMHTEQTASFSARAARDALGLRDDDVVWMPSPIGHSTGLNYGVRVALHHGLTLVLQDRWSAEVAARLVESRRVSYTVAATTFLADLVEHASATGSDLSSLRLFGSGGAPIPPELVAAADEHGITVLRLYGSTESLVATWNRPDSSREKRVETDGRALDHVEVEVRSETGQALVGEPGEIVVRGPNTTVGLFADPDRTAAAFDGDGWLRQGDLGVLDADGYLTIVGRVKEIVIRGGLNIAPREIEELTLQHAAVAEVAVVGVPHPRLGEQACAFVVLREGTTLELPELVAFLKAHGLATFKLPERLVVVDALPRTPTGKVQKFALVSALSERADRVTS